ncbi:MAG: hypothetical protein RBS39_03160 [Phycisphaerales bacterium]|jgi:hypothetical protein|nr:hypothetical protein [Phycisphaerales bacterium]
MERPARESIYVNYLPTPRRFVMFLRVLVPVALWSTVLTGLLIAWTQPSPGAGVWDTSEVKTFEGVLVVEPYPMLLADDLGEGHAGAALLVEQGKFGVARGLDLAGRRVRVRGNTLTRDGLVMIELRPEVDAIAPEASANDAASATAHAPSDARDARKLGTTMLHGEIVDSKCYLGAMKPGAGKTHKACATLCVKGGIPPVLVSREDGRAVFTLLVDLDGGVLDASHHPFIGEPVEVRGELETRGGVRVLRVPVGGVTRR